jgi:hypothetical protein
MVDDSAAQAVSGPAVAIIFIIGAAIVYGFLAPTSLNAKVGTRQSYQLILLIIMIIIQFYINWSTYKGMCGNVQFLPIIMSTFIPWLLIVGIAIVLLNMFPGWCQPFSNTIGYFLVYQFGNLPIIWSKCFGNIDEKKSQLEDLKKKDKDNVTEIQKLLNTTNTLEKIINQSWLVINQIPPQKPGFLTFWEDCKKNNLLSKAAATEDVINGNNKDANALYQLIAIKQTISEVVWLAALGALTVLVSNNLLIMNSCERSPDELAATAQSTFNSVKGTDENQGSQTQLVDYGL